MGANQCSAELKHILEGPHGCDTTKSGNSVAKLLTMINGNCCQFDLLYDEHMAIAAAIKNLSYSSRRQSNRMLTSTKTSQRCSK